MKSHRQLQLRSLLNVIADTRETEFDCAECSRHVAELAERMQSPRGSLIPTLDLTRHHLSICQQCSEDFRLLQSAIECAQ